MVAPQRIRRFALAASGRLLREWARLRRLIRRNGSAQPVLKAIGTDNRADVAVWTAKTSERHEAYRLAVQPITGSVAVICSSNRPADLPNLLRSVGDQSHADLELVLVAHGGGWDMAQTEEALDGLDGQLRRVQLLSMPDDVSLGHCLNAALLATDARFVAKFDSDDRYGHNYLVDALRAHGYAGAGIVGKHTYYTHLEATDEYWLRFPGNEFRYTGTMSGGTFVIDRDIVDDQPFADVSLGEDRDYLRRAHRRGISTFAIDRFNYTVVRSGHNTWTIPVESLLAGAIRLDTAEDASQIDR